MSREFKPLEIKERYVIGWDANGSPILEPLYQEAEHEIEPHHNWD